MECLYWSTSPFVRGFTSTQSLADTADTTLAKFFASGTASNAYSINSAWWLMRNPKAKVVAQMSENAVLARMIIRLLRHSQTRRNTIGDLSGFHVVFVQTTQKPNCFPLLVHC